MDNKRTVAMSDEEWDEACSVLNQINTRNIQPILIDFGGLTLYNCGVQIDQLEISPPEDPHDDVNNIEKDIKAILQIDSIKLKSLFQKWKARTQVSRLNTYQAIFSRWQRLYVYRQKKRERENQQKKEILQGWRLLACETKTQKTISKIKVKYDFKQWKKATQMKLLSKRIENSVAMIKKKKFLRKWKFAASRHRNAAKQNKIQQKFVNKTLRRVFDVWSESYLAKVRKLNTNTYLMRRMFDRWNERFDKSQNLGVKYNTVRLETERRVQLQVFVLWQRKAKIHHKKRVRQNTENWGIVSQHLLQFYRVKLSSARIIEARVFKIAMARIQVKQKEELQAAFDQWKLVIEMKRRKKDAANVTQRFLLRRMLSTWFFTWRSLDDQRTMETVRKCVVEPHMRAQFFGLWLDRATENIRERKLMAIRLRKRLLKLRALRAWHDMVEMQSLRAEEHSGRRTLAKAFAAFRAQTVEAKREKEKRAEDHFKMVLKRRTFRRLKLTLPSKNIDEDAFLSNLITSLNQDGYFTTLMY